MLLSILIYIVCRIYANNFLVQLFRGSNVFFLGSTASIKQRYNSFFIKNFAIS